MKKEFMSRKKTNLRTTEVENELLNQAKLVEHDEEGLHARSDSSNGQQGQANGIGKNEGKLKTYKKLHFQYFKGKKK